MLRILAAVFFWLCAVGVLALSVRAEIRESRRPAKAPKAAIHRTPFGQLRR